VFTFIILIAFPRQQWLRERASLLRCTFIACLMLFFFNRAVSSKLILQIFAETDSEQIAVKFDNCILEFDYKCCLNRGLTFVCF
jgi:hypothetical protein